MNFSKDIAKGLVSKIKDLTMTEKTVVLYLYYYANQGESLSTKQIAVNTGLGLRTVRTHTEVLKLHGVIELGEPTGREKRRKITVHPVTSQTLPSPILSLLYKIIDIPSQKTYARLYASNTLNNNDLEEESKARVGSKSSEVLYTGGIAGLRKAARRAVNIAVQSGELKKPSTCSVCGKDCVPEVHHPNGYDEDHWLDIEWLCRSCRYYAENNNRKAGEFSLYDIVKDEDWIRAKGELQKYFKPFEIDPKTLINKKRFSKLVELLSNDDITFNEYCKWYAQEKYPDKGFNFGLFLYPNMILEYQDYAMTTGKYLKTTTNMGTSKSHTKGVEQTKTFLENLKEDE